MNSLISIIIPVYNVQDYLDECIQSVLHQTYTNLEIILIDDGSTDSSGKLCDDYAAIDNRIRVVHTPNGGISHARNQGLDIASGAYIFFLDSDDYLEPDAIEHLYQNLLAHNADISVGSLCDVNEDRSLLGDDILPIPNPVTVLDERNFLAFSLTHKIGVMVTVKLYKRFIWETLRFPEGKIHEDDASLIGILRQTNTIVCSRKVCMNYRMRSGSIMHTAFSIRNMDKVRMLAERANYFLDKEYYEYCYGTYFSGMKLISEAYLSKEHALVSRAKQEYRTYRLLAKKIYPHTENYIQKCSLLLFSLHLGLYTLLRYKLKKDR